MKKRTGILGGTFDPVHTGHLILAETVLSDQRLDRILFIPAKTPPHKLDAAVSHPSDRLAMLRLAIQNQPTFSVSECEIAREGPSYTVDTLSYLKSTDVYRDDQFFLIIGADNLVEIHTWKHPDRIFEMATVLCLARPGEDVQQAVEPYRSNARMIQAPLISISATEIRNRVKKGLSIQYWVPDLVADYIVQKGLYRA